MDEPAILALAAASGQAAVDVSVRLPPSRRRPDGGKIRAADYTKLTPLACRLIIKRLPVDAAQKAENRAAHRKRQTPGPTRIPSAKFLFILTNLLPDRFGAKTICQIYRLRWQIETAFKHLKSLIRLEHFEAIDERLVKSVLYAKLILALVSQTLVAQAIALAPSASIESA